MELAEAVQRDMQSPQIYSDQTCFECLFGTIDDFFAIFDELHDVRFHTAFNSGFASCDEGVRRSFVGPDPELEISSSFERVRNILKMYAERCAMRVIPGHFEDISHVQCFGFSSTTTISTITNIVPGGGLF